MVFVCSFMLLRLWLLPLLPGGQFYLPAGIREACSNLMLD